MAEIGDVAPGVSIESVLFIEFSLRRLNKSGSTRCWKFSYENSKQDRHWKARCFDPVPTINTRLLEISGQKKADERISRCQPEASQR